MGDRKQCDPVEGASVTTNLPIMSRPDGITCVDWQPRDPAPGKKRCSFYMPPDATKNEVGALCSLSNHFLCSEWEKANPTRIAEALASAPKPAPIEPEPPRATPPLALVPSPAPAPAPVRARAEGQNAHRQPGQVLPPAKEIPEGDLAALEQLGVEVCLATPGLRDVWLVNKLTGAPDRFEMTWRQAATVRLIVDAFPGAKLVALNTTAKGGAL